jgi:hypothetical protein
MRVPAVFTMAGLVLIAVSAAACSGGSGSAAAPSSTAGAAGSSSATASAGSAAPAGATTKLDVCGALPAAMAAQITGTSFTSSKPGEVSGVVFSCEYDGPNAALLQISVSTQDGTGAYDAMVSC